MQVAKSAKRSMQKFVKIWKNLEPSGVHTEKA
jgi:hypothetical protein